MGNHRHATLIPLNSDAKALCLRPDPEATQGIQGPAAPPLRGVLPECRRQGSPRSLVILVAARTRTRGVGYKPHQ